MRCMVATLLAILSLAGCQDGETPATHPSLRAATLPRLISAKEFYSASLESWGHRLSPDGERLAWLARARNKPTLYVRALNDGAKRSIEHRGRATLVHWAQDSRRLLIFADAGNGLHLFLADADSPGLAPRDLTPLEGVSVKRLFTPAGTPGSIFVEMGIGAGHGYDLYEVHLDTGQHQRVVRDHGRTSRWILGRAGEVVGRLQVLRDGGWELQAPDGTGWRRVLGGWLQESIAVAGNLSRHESKVYVQTNAGRDKVGFVTLDLKNGQQEVLFEPPNVDLSRSWTHPSSLEPLAVLYHDGFPRYHYFDRRLQEDLEDLLGRGPVLYDFYSVSDDRMRLIVGTETDRSGVATYLVDRRSGKKELLAAHPVNEFSEVLSDTRPIRFNARDGLPITGYLTLPRGTGGKHLPMVLKVHGGPWLRDLWGFDSDTQFLANRGYAVLEVNFRGSVGFGKTFTEKGRKEFGGKMQDDLLDAVDWAVAEGYADPEKVAIFGYSYGGYATLMGLARTPERFAAGIDVMGMSDLALQVRAFPPESWGTRTWWTLFVGDPDSPDGYRQLMERSPITYADRIERPLLIVHGAKDARVSKENSDRLVDKLRKKDVSVEYLVFPDEGHGISKTKNRILFAHRMETFLAKYLGGRAQTR